MNQGTIMKFSGHSDDIIVVEIIQPVRSHVTHTEISANEPGPTKILVQTIGGARAVYVYAHYDGCWHFSVCQLEESRKIPSNWKITTDQMDDHEYSARLTIDAFAIAGDLLDAPKVVP